MDLNKGIRGALALAITRHVIAAFLLVLAGRALNANAQTVTSLYSFDVTPNDGTLPDAGLVQGSDGNFYGTASGGGKYGGGTVFRISPNGSETNLYYFHSSPTDGNIPIAGLVQGSDGNFYGTTQLGGTYNYYGTVFRISPAGSYTNLYSFAGPPTNAYKPAAGLAQGTDGYFYGTTQYGGTNGCNCGTVFRISPSGTETTLCYFGSSPNDGQAPVAGLVQGSDGNFYGTTSAGGSSGGGVVFRISPSGTETTLYSFGSSPNDGQAPIAGLVQGSDGNYYGTTSAGGPINPYCPSGCGTVFRISPSGNYTNFHSFAGYPSDGAGPSARLIQASDGNFFGTTSAGGTGARCYGGCGTVFRISPSGTETTLYSFAGYPSDGADPSGGLVQGSDSSFYGTTTEGGTSGAGTVFRLFVPPAPVTLDPPPYPINQITAVQRAGTNAVFNVVSIAGETYQLQFSNSMTPTNWVNVTGVSVTNSIGALLTVTNFGGAIGPHGFYRFDITP